MDKETKNVISLGIICAALGAALGFGWGFIHGAGYIREKCETTNVFYYKHTNTTYYCASEQQLKEVQNDLSTRRTR